MDASLLRSPNWYKAVTLTERLISLRASQHMTSNSGRDAHLAKQHMENWRLQPPFTIGSYFAQRLAMDGISEEEFLSLLGEPIESVCDRFPIPPAWLTELLQAFSWPSSPKSGACSRLWYDPEVLFVDLITPLLYEGCERLSQGVQELVLARADLPFAPDTVEDIRHYRG